MAKDHKVIVDAMPTLTPINYLETDLIDDDIKAIYEVDSHNVWFGYEPLLAQLIKELRLTREAMREARH